MIRMVRVHQCILLGWLLGSDRTYPTKIRLNCVEKHPLYNAIQELWMATMDYHMGFSENLQNPIKKGKMGVSGRVCWYVACYDFVLGFNVSSLVLMIFQVGFWGSF